MWEFGGLWDEVSWQRKPQILRRNLYIEDNGEKLWLYQVEDAVIMVEVKPSETTQMPIGQVVLKRLITADQAIERLCLEKGDPASPLQPPYQSAPAQ